MCFILAGIALLRRTDEEVPLLLAMLGLIELILWSAFVDIQGVLR